MKFSKQDLVKIAERASTLQERIDGLFVPDKAGTDEKTVNSRLKKWQKITDPHNKGKFDKRLQWDDLDSEMLRPILGNVRFRDDQSLPEWTNTLNQVMEKADTVYPETWNDFCLIRPRHQPPVEDDLFIPFLEGAFRFSDPEERQPFEELFIPFIKTARVRLAEKAGTHLALVSEQALTSLERGLLQRLAMICFRSFQLEYSYTRLMGKARGKTRYTDFVTSMYKGGFLSFFREYSVLARLTVQVTDFWTQAVKEFLQHLAEDMLLIRETFQTSEPGQVKNIRTSLSDPHNQGRSVIGLEFESGLGLFYKPKEMSVEKAWSDLLCWLNQNGAPLQFHTLKIISCSTHGWAETAKASPCRNTRELREYYRRSGVLLCLVYALRGTDFHFENIIACGKHPVPVDLETLLNPLFSETAKVKSGENAQLRAEQIFMESVMNTHFLPKWHKSTAGMIYDMSGLGQEPGTRILGMTNTDNIEAVQKTAKMTGSKNSPFASASQNSLNNYVEDVVAGFEEMYLFLLRKQKILLQRDSPLAMFSEKRFRLVFQLTQTYYFLLLRSLNPKCVREGVDRSIELDMLARNLLNRTEKPQTWPVLGSELRAMEQMDIPCLTFRADNTALEAKSGLSVPNVFTEPSYKTMLRRIRQMSWEDSARQAEIIRGSVYSRIISRHEKQSPGQFFEDTGMSDKDQLTEQALRIGHELGKRAIHGEDGSICWIGMDYDIYTNLYNYQPMNFGFNSGISGVAVFLAALEKMTRAGKFRDLVLGAFRPWQQNLEQVHRQISADAGNGLASVAYGLALAGEFLDEPGLTESARQTAILISLNHILADKYFDVMRGTAGILLVLLRLHEITGDTELLEKFLVCGEHLLDNRKQDQTGYRAWETPEGNVLTGFSNGMAGIAYALLRLYGITQDQRFREAAQEGIARENTGFSSESGNWHDFCSPGISNGKSDFMKSGFITSWCNGVPGIALARIAGLSFLDTDDIRQDIEVALQTTQNFGVSSLDNICCGNFGRIETLLTASQKLSRPELFETAQRQTAWIVNRAEKGDFRIFNNLVPVVCNPAFFQGTSGIGYELLRLAYPEILPSVLLWE